MKIIKKSYSGTPLKDTFFSFVVMSISRDPTEISAHFEDRGWIVSLAREHPREDSPSRRRRRLMDRDYDDRRDGRSNEKFNNRYSSYKDRTGRSRDEREDTELLGKRNEQPELAEESYFQNEAQQYEGHHAFEQDKPVIPCKSSSLSNPSTFAKLLMLPSEIFQNVIVQMAQNCRPALVGRN